MLVSKDAYFLNFLIVCLIFYLFVFIISIFGYIFFYYIRKLNKNDWELNSIEILLVSFAIGLSIYISFSFILDIFLLFNFLTAYYSIIIIDALFIWYLIYRGELSKETFINILTQIKRKVIIQTKKTIFLILILIFVFGWQIYVQWSIITDEYAIPSKDTYVWLGQSWYLLERGYLWREHLILHYPKGYTFFLVGPELIYPDWRLAYFYMKFAGIPFFSFYIIVIFIILKKLFEDTYIIFIGLLLTLLSNFLFSRFNSFVSSSICALLILISLIILNSKAPFYLVAFFISSIFLFNALFALFYIIAIALLLLIKIIFVENEYKTFFIDYIGKTLVILIILLSSYIIHAIIVQNITLFDLIIEYLMEFGYSEAFLSNRIESINSTIYLLQFRYILQDIFPNNSFMSQFLDIEKKLLSYFFIFTLISLFLPTKKFFNRKNRDIINFAKISVLILIGFYIAEIIFKESSNVFAYNLPWFKWRVLEALAGPLIILSCFTIEKIISKAKILTIYLTRNNSYYRNLMNHKIFSYFLRLENLLITLLLISTISTVFYQERIYTSYYFEQDHVDAVFYIKENVPHDSKILVTDFDDTTNSFYELLSTYKFYIWDFEFSENNFNETIDYIEEKDIDYIMLDHKTINSTEESYFNSYSDFEELYENDIYIIFKVES